jgi:hypothetical protein
MAQAQSTSSDTQAMEEAKAHLSEPTEAEPNSRVQIHG